VLSIGKLTVEQSRYYERQVAQGRDDYYSGRGESPGRWTGAGADGLRLGGRVEDDGLMALMDGRDPGTGERLRRVSGRSKVAAFDLTFSAPKSVSLLFAIGERSWQGRWSTLMSRRSTRRWDIWSVRRVGCVAAGLVCGVRWGRGLWRRRIAIA
jgi:TrwC relaxase